MVCGPLGYYRQHFASSNGEKILQLPSRWPFFVVVMFTIFANTWKGFLCNGRSMHVKRKKLWWDPFTFRTYRQCSRVLFFQIFTDYYFDLLLLQLISCDDFARNRFPIMASFLNFIPFLIQKRSGDHQESPTVIFFC